MAPGIETTDAELITAEAWASISQGEGSRIGLLGDSRCGKTEAARRLIKGYMKRSPGFVYIVDDKEAQPQYEGQYRRDRADVERNPPDPNGPRPIVFRGDRTDRAGEVDPEEIADMQWAHSQKREPSLTVYDELDKAANHGQWRRGDKHSTILWSFRRGGSSGASVLWGTQETQEVPAAAFNQSNLILVFRMQGAPLRLLGDRGYLEPRGGVEKVIPTLPGPPLTPPEQRGHFVALRRGQSWDGKIYRFR
jgi:hypothetical protein